MDSVALHYVVAWDSISCPCVRIVQTRTSSPSSYNLQRRIGRGRRNLAVQDCSDVIRLLYLSILLFELRYRGGIGAREDGKMCTIPKRFQCYYNGTTRRGTRPLPSASRSPARVASVVAGEKNAVTLDIDT